MKIALVRKRYTPYGGGETFLSIFIDELIKRGHECHIFAERWKDEERDGFTFHRVRVIRWPSFLRVLSFAISTYSALKKNPVDVVIGFDKTFHQDIYRAGDGCHREWLMRRQRVRGKGQGARARRLKLLLKRIITYINPLHITILYLEKRLFQSMRLRFVVANSNRGKEEIIRHYGLPEEKVHVIYNGVNIKDYGIADKERLKTYYRKAFNIAPGDCLLLFVGSGFERKGLKFLLEAMVVLKEEGERGLRLLVVGKGDVKRYFRYSKRIGLEREVIFIGPVTEVMGYYWASDIFVLPVIYEPFSNACLEAMAAGLPVITSKANGISEIITHQKDGYIIEDPTDPHEIAKAIGVFLDNNRREAVGEMARVTASSYSIGKNIENMLALLTLIPIAKNRA